MTTRPSKRAVMEAPSEPAAKPVSAASALLAYIEACKAQSENERLERCVRQHIANERLKAYALRFEWCERGGGSC